MRRCVPSPCPFWGQVAAALLMLPGAGWAAPGLANAILRAAQNAPTAAETTLERQFGLTRRAKGEVWVTARETALRRRLAELPRLVERVRSVGDAVAAARERNRVLWAQRQSLEQSLRKKIGELSPSDPQRKQMEASLKQMDSLAVPPEKLGGAASIQPQLIDMTNARHAILLGAWAVRADAAMLSDEYKALRRNEEVAAALLQLGGEHRLGPLKDYGPDLRRLTEYEQFVYAQPQPLYLQSGQLRVGAILNESTPITLSWRDSNEPTTLTASIAQAAGIEPPADAPTTALTLAGNRRVTAHKIVLSSVRFGVHVLRDVEAYVLPPEAEDLGAQISRAAFTHLRVVAEPAMLRFRVEAVE